MATVPNPPSELPCPVCAHPKCRVVDSRGEAKRTYVRRRRECLACQHRFSTFEIYDTRYYTRIRTKFT